MRNERKDKQEGKTTEQKRGPDRAKKERPGEAEKYKTEEER